MNKTVALLLSTYNGERYLDELLQSLRNQSFQNFLLYIRDDGSTDQTADIIKRFCQLNSNAVYVNEDHSNNLGVINSFSILLETALANECIDYFMFVDQDDLWLDNKVELSLREIQRLEQKCELIKPILFHTDLQVVNDSLTVVSNSFWQYQNLNPKRTRFGDILVQNNVTGCSMIINRSLAKLSAPFPSGIIMHDWWLALVASCFGEIGWSSSPTILYRQHNTNQVGAKKVSLFNVAKKLQENDLVRKTIVQADTFLGRYDKRVTTDNQELLKAYINLSKQNVFSRIATIIKYKFYKHGLLRNLGFFLIIVTKKGL